MNRIIAYVLILSAFAACTAGEPCLKCEEAAKAQQVQSVSLSIGRGALPSECVGSDSCQIYIFSGDGTLYNRFSGEGEDFEFFIGSGVYDIYAFANAPQLPLSPESAEELTGHCFSLVDNKPGKLVTAGCLESVAITESSALELEMEHLVSKVNYNVRVDIENEILIRRGFKVLSVYMTNVVGECLPFSSESDSPATVWYNLRNFESSEADSLIFSQVDEFVANGDSLHGTSTFYILPNSCSDPQDRSGLTPRKTRFVVKALIGNQVYYYPVTIPRAEGNREYIISLTVKNIGCLDPEDTDVTAQAAESSIAIQGWNAAQEIEYER